MKMKYQKERNDAISDELSHFKQTVQFRRLLDHHIQLTEINVSIVLLNLLVDEEFTLAQGN